MLMTLILYIVVLLHENGPFQSVIECIQQINELTGQSCLQLSAEKIEVIVFGSRYVKGQ